MLKNPAYVFFFVLIPLCAIAGPKEKSKEKKTATFEAVRVRTQIHESSGIRFSYTDQIFAEIDGRRLVYECAQRGDICPVLESGKTYTGDQDGHFLYLASSFPDGQKDLSVKFKQVGSW